MSQPIRHHGPSGKASSLPGDDGTCRSGQPTNGRSQRAGYRAPAARQALTVHRRDEHRAPAPRGRSSVRLTGRGAILLMLTVFALGLLAASWLGEGVVPGVAFLVGSVTAARFSRRTALLAVSVTPPLLFFCVLVTVKAMTATGNVALSTAEGSALTLAQTAPWLLAGAAASLAIAWFRGLPRYLGDLRQGPRQDRPGQRAR